MEIWKCSRCLLKTRAKIVYSVKATTAIKSYAIINYALAHYFYPLNLSARNFYIVSVSCFGSKKESTSMIFINS